MKKICRECGKDFETTRDDIEECDFCRNAKWEKQNEIRRNNQKEISFRDIASEVMNIFYSIFFYGLAQGDFINRQLSVEIIKELSGYLNVANSTFVDISIILGYQCFDYFGIKPCVLEKADGIYLSFELKNASTLDVQEFNRKYERKIIAF